MKFERFARTFCRNVGTFGANLCKLFPNLRIRHSKVGQETWKLGARMNRFDCKDGSHAPMLAFCLEVRSKTDLPMCVCLNHHYLYLV